MTFVLTCFVLEGFQGNLLATEGWEERFSDSLNEGSPFRVHVCLMSDQCAGVLLLFVLYL